VSTAADLATFYQALLHDPAGLWDPAVLADATGNVRNHLPDRQTGVPANRALSIVLAGDDGRAAFRGFGHTSSARAFGHGGAGGQIAWADPETGISFAWLTDGLDSHLLRQWRRTAGIASRAGTLGRSLAGTPS
jgi:CubicO group peptidase (beta-lactamase class C family)